MTADLSVVSRELAVDVRHADLVEINQGDISDPASRECLRRPRSHPADSDHGNMRVLQ